MLGHWFYYFRIDHLVSLLQIENSGFVLWFPIFAWGSTSTLTAELRTSNFDFLFSTCHQKHLLIILIGPLKKSFHFEVRWPCRCGASCLRGITIDQWKLQSTTIFPFKFVFTWPNWGNSLRLIDHYSEYSQGGFFIQNILKSYEKSDSV